MKIPEIEWEVIETIMEEMGKFKNNPKGMINIVSQFNLEQPALAFSMGMLFEQLSKGGIGESSTLLTCVAIMYKTIKNAVEASNLDEQFKKGNDSK